MSYNNQIIVLKKALLYLNNRRILKPFPRGDSKNMTPLVNDGEDLQLFKCFKAYIISLLSCVQINVTKFNIIIFIFFFILGFISNILYQTHYVRIIHKSKFTTKDL